MEGYRNWDVESGHQIPEVGGQRSFDHLDELLHSADTHSHRFTSRHRALGEGPVVGARGNDILSHFT